MAEVPEHLLQRSRERRKALGLPVPGEEGAPAEAGAEPTAAAAGGTGAPGEGGGGPGAGGPGAGGGDAGGGDAGGGRAPGADDGGDDAGDGGGRIPAHLLERSKRRRAALTGTAEEAPAAAAAAAGAGAATAVAAPPAPTATGPGGHTQRLLTVVKSGSIQQTRAEAQDKVHVWPHLLVIEFASILVITAAVTVFSAVVRAPLLELADLNKTPNPSKAPWYFLGLQELLTMFHPMVAGVTIPGVGLGLLALAPFIDKNPSHKPTDRKFAIAVFTMFIMLWAVLVIIGSFFRGKGFNFVFPWNDGVFFDL